MQSNRNIKAGYRTVGPKIEPVTYNKCWMDEETKSLQLEMVTEEKKCWYVYFPNGHSIRLTDFEELKRMGYHLRPRLVDMETGDVVDRGGDPYDFANVDESDVILESDPPRKRTREAANF